MGAKLIVAPEAQSDLDEAYDWYESRSFGLGERFLFRVDACIASIHRAPKMYPVVAGNLRRAFIRQFPYIIYYIHKRTGLTVFAVLHSARDPNTIRMRLPKFP